MRGDSLLSLQIESGRLALSDRRSTLGWIPRPLSPLTSSRNSRTKGPPVAIWGRGPYGAPSSLRLEKLVHFAALAFGRAPFSFFSVDRR